MASRAIHLLEDPPRTTRAPRRRVYLRGRIETTTRRFDIMIRNLSCTGAQAEGEALPPPGRDILLEAGPVSVICHVVWVEDGRCGLSFDEPLPQHLVLELHRHIPDLMAEKREAWHAARAWASGA